MKEEVLEVMKGIRKVYEMIVDENDKLGRNESPRDILDDILKEFPKVLQLFKREIENGSTWIEEDIQDMTVAE